jgi:PRC-barrel domain
MIGRLPVLCVALLVAMPAFAQDQPKDQTKTEAPKPAPKQPAPVKAAPTPPPPPHVVTPKGQADSLLGKQVYGADGRQMGLVTNVLIDREGKPIALVIDFGGFLGVGTRKIAVDWHLMQFHPGDKNKPVTLALTKDQLKSAPEYRQDKSAPVIYAPAPAPLPEQPAAKPPPASAPNPPAQETDHNGPK